MAETGKKRAQPLEGLKVLDLTSLLPGPLCTMILGDYGAEIIKVENVETGDPTRFAGSSYKGGKGPVGTLFKHLNRNKKSLALDLKNEEGREILKALAAASDILVEGFRPGVMDRLGLGYRVLSGLNGRLVYAAITGYGYKGPYRDKAGHDLNYTALSGLLELSAGEDGKPVVPATQIADIGGGALMALNGIMFALYERERTGAGRFVDVSMTRGLLPWLAYPASFLDAGAELPRCGRGLLSGSFACYNIYETGDGKFMSLGALEPVFWRRFCEAVGKEQWIDRQYAQEQDQPVGNRELIQEVRTLFKSKSRKEWEVIFANLDACCEPVLDLNEAIKHPLSQEGNYWLEATPAKAAKTTRVGFPLLFSGQVGELRLPPPEHGEHTLEILEKLDYDYSDLEEMKKRGIIKTS